MKINKTSVLALRNAQAWSQEDLAAAAGVSVRTIQRMESQGVSSLETLKGVAAAFDVELVEICKPDWEWRHVAYFLKPFWKYYFIGTGLAVIGAVVFVRGYVSEATASYWAGILIAALTLGYMFECYLLYQKEFGRH